MIGEICNDNREILIAKYFELLKELTNIETSYEEMQVIRTILFRFWQLGWLDALEKKRNGTLVEVVRCKDCYYWTKVDDEPKGVCVCRTNLQAALMGLAPQTEENDYCSWGEREEGEE